MVMIAEHMLKRCSPLPVMVTSQCELKILECDDKQTNKQTGRTLMVSLGKPGLSGRIMEVIEYW